MKNYPLLWLTVALWVATSTAIPIASAESPKQLNAAAAPDADWIPRCKALSNADFASVVDAPMQVLAAKAVDADGYLPAYCEISGYVASHVGFAVRLPTHWNGKYLQVGCGGLCGVVFAPVCNPGLRKGYACLVSDMGHQGKVTDGVWGYDNLEARVDFGFRATHVAALAGKAITEHYYAQEPQKSYFMGCSCGGRQALQEAQRFPWDFDGIVAGSPPVNWAMIFTTFAWGARVTHDAAGKPLLNAEDLKLLTNAAVTQCDLDDGAKDGIIGDPVHCAFDPGRLACKAGQTHGCLTAEQITAAQKVYAGPMTSQGKKLWSGGPLPGSEYGLNRWSGEINYDWRDSYDLAGGNPTIHAPIMLSGFRYLLFSPAPGPTWQLRDFDFDRDYKRLDLVQSFNESGNPDLRRFKAAGGKLIMYQNLNDISVLPRATIDYYETVERTMGGRAATEDFARLFLLPGTQHCTGGDGAFAADWLTHLEAWVEQGHAPDKVLSAHVKPPEGSSGDFKTTSRALEFPLNPATIVFTRPVYPYPTRAKYSGHGDPNDAANWGPARP